MPDTLVNQTCHVISLEPEGARFRTFLANNGHLRSLNVFKAIKGADIPRDTRVSSGLLTPELLVSGEITEGTVGCAASHRAVWQKIADTDTGAVILEDDVFTHPSLPDFLNANSKLLSRAEIVFFTVNTNSVMASQSPEGLTSFEVFAPVHPDQAWIEAAFAATRLSDVKIHRMRNGFGLCCYWVSPQGAKRMLKECFPLTLEAAAIPLMPNPWPGSAIDGRLNAFLPAMNAYIVRPFLAYSPNSDSSTSV